MSVRQSGILLSAIEHILKNTTAAFIAVFMCRPWKKFRKRNIRDGNNCLVAHKHVLRRARISEIFDIILQRD